MKKFLLASALVLIFSTDVSAQWWRGRYYQYPTYSYYYQYPAYSYYADYDDMYYPSYGYSRYYYPSYGYYNYYSSPGWDGGYYRGWNERGGGHHHHR